MKRLLGLALLCSAGWFAWGFHVQSKTRDDFDACNVISSEDHFSEQRIRRSRGMTAASPQESHDVIDEAIDRCMLSRGYEPNAQREKDCLSEKLPMCYTLPMAASLLP